MPDLVSCLLVLRLFSNESTQNEQIASISDNIAELGGYGLLVPAKNKRDQKQTGSLSPDTSQERDMVCYHSASVTRSINPRIFSTIQWQVRVMRLHQLCQR